MLVSSVLLNESVEVAEWWSKGNNERVSQEGEDVRAASSSDSALSAPHDSIEPREHLLPLLHHHSSLLRSHTITMQRTHAHYLLQKQ